MMVVSSDYNGGEKLLLPSEVVAFCIVTSCIIHVFMVMLVSTRLLYKRIAV